MYNDKLVYKVVIEWFSYTFMKREQNFKYMSTFTFTRMAFRNIFNKFTKLINTQLKLCLLQNFAVCNTFHLRP